MSTAMDIAPRVRPPNVDDDTHKLAHALSQVLANTFILSLKTQNFHWNVEGPTFYTLHLMFAKQYEELWRAGHEIAGRIRALGFAVPGSYREFATLTCLQEPESIPSATGMIGELLCDHETCARTIRAALDDSRNALDAATEELLTQRLLAHEKAVWMLGSLLA